MYSITTILLQMGKRANANIMFHSSLPVLFPVKHYADALWEQVSYSPD